MEGLTRGQPIKYRYAGQTEAGSAGSKAISSIMTASDYVISTLEENPLTILPAVMGGSEESKDFMRAVFQHFSFNYHERFDTWYRGLNPGARGIVSSLGVKIEEHDVGRRKPEFIVCESYAFGNLPTDFPLSEKTWAEIRETNRKIDEDKGVQEFTYGVVKTANNGYKEAKNFRLGDFFSWAALGGIVLTDPHHKYDIVPITKDELLLGLNAEINLFEPRINQGGLDGAIEARKQYLLQGIYFKISQLKNGSNDGIIEVIESDNLLPAPGTGVYAVGLRDGLRKTDFKPFAVKVNPRHEESKVAKVLETMAMKDGMSGHLEAFEVPEKALKFVTNPQTLELKLA